MLTSLTVPRTVTCALFVLAAAAARAQSPAPDPLRPAREAARAGRVDDALAALLRAAENGFFGMAALEKDPDLAAVRSHPRFAEVRRVVDRNLRPCVYQPEYRALDFWVGEWDVRPRGAAEGTRPSRSRIELIEDQCVVYEAYSNPAGYSGRSFNAYQPEAKRWEQFWVDNKGARHHYVGEARDGNLYYEADGVRAGGPSSPPAKVRMTFFNQGQDQVRQLGEQSTDGGRTWSVTYDLVYRRRPASAESVRP